MNNKISFQQGIATTLNLVSLSTIFFMAGKINYSIYMLLIRNMKQIVWVFFKLKQFLEMENAWLEAENFVCHANMSKIWLTYYTLHHSY